MNNSGSTILVIRPAMFANKPLLWLGSLITIPIGVGLIAFIVWRVLRHTNQMIITKEYVMTKVGIFNTKTVQVFHRDVSRLNVNQSFWQRLTGVGTIEIGSSATGDIDIRAVGFPDPNHIRFLINSNRTSYKNMPNENRAHGVDSPNCVCVLLKEMAPSHLLKPAPASDLRRTNGPRWSGFSLKQGKMK